MKILVIGLIGVALLSQGCSKSNSISGGTGSSSNGSSSSPSPIISGISVAPTDNLQTLVNQYPAGTTFVLQPGVHQDHVTTLKNGDIFTSPDGTTSSGAVENGSTQLTSWTQVTIKGIAYWTKPGSAPIIDGYTPFLNCMDPSYPHPTQTCYLSQLLYLNSNTYEHSYRLSDVTSGKWYYEFQGITSVTVVAGGSGYAVGDVLTVTGGTGCPSASAGCGSVIVASVASGTNAVTGVSIKALGYNYPAGPVTEATTESLNANNIIGTGSGATVSITGGSGGVTNNVYLALSENPNASHIVELGMGSCGTGCSPNWLFESDSVQNITIQGLTVEKYPGYNGSAPISVNHIGAGSGGTAAGWVIQNNEVLLNNSMGIGVWNGTQGVPIQILNNIAHNNGDFGIGGGAPTSFITVSGNEIYSNDTAFVPSGYGCGSIKFGGPSVGGGGMLISYNTVHDEPYGAGLWSDEHMGNVTWDHNTVTNITGEGIRIEISGTGPINVTNNTVTGSSGSSIDVVSSSNVTVQHNDVTASSTSRPAMSIQYDGRSCNPTGVTFCQVPPANNSISLNSIQIASTGSGLGSQGVDSTKNPSWLVSGIFSGNTYCVSSSPWSALSWLFGEAGSSFSNFSTWQKSSGQDSTGTVTTGTCPDARQ